MKFVENNELLAMFVKKFVNCTRNKVDRGSKTAMALMAGTILLNRASPNAIHHELVTPGGKANFYRDIHELTNEMPTIYDDAFAVLQRDAKMKMRKHGVLILDEHLIEHSSDDIEGVASYYSSSEKRYMLAMSTITMHYRSGKVEYPVAIEIYRRLEELKTCGKDAKYRKKNDIARELIQRIFMSGNAPSLFLFDSGFMTKENVKLLQFLHVNYISRPKKPWTGIWKHKKYSMTELFEVIPANEFEKVTVLNPKTRKKREQLVATRNVFFSKIGMHRVVFVDCTKEEKEEDEKEAKETQTTATGRRFRLFITNVLTWDAATILRKYSLRWAIETSYRDMNQNLSLGGCKWRELSAQYFFIALTFLCYLFLAWVKVNGFLANYNSESRTIGQLKQAFTHYCQHQYTLWWMELKQGSNTCCIDKFVMESIYARS